MEDPWFTLVVLEIKKIEAYLDMEKYKQIKDGDTIIFTNELLKYSYPSIKRTCTVTVFNILTYKNFKEYLKEECLPSITDIKNGLEIYNNGLYSSESEKHKIIAFILEFKNIFHTY